MEDCFDCLDCSQIKQVQGCMDEIGQKQKLFLTKSLVQRNKQFYDIDQVNRVENIREIKRRHPKNKWQIPRDRFNTSFMNSTTAAESRIEREIDKFRDRLSYDRYIKDNESTNDGSNAAPTCYPLVSKTYSVPRKIRGVVPMELCLPRKGILADKELTHDQRLYNNFKLTEPDLAHTSDISKIVGRKDSKATCSHDLNYNVANFQDIRYDNSGYRCLVDYKLQKPEDGRVYFRWARSTDIPATDLNPERIDYGLTKTEHFRKTDINPFFNCTGKELPSQLLMRTMQANQNFWKIGDKYDRPALDFSLRRMRDISKEQKVARRRPGISEIKREEVCMEYYFRRNK